MQRSNQMLTLCAVAIVALVGGTQTTSSQTLPPYEELTVAPEWDRTLGFGMGLEIVGGAGMTNTGMTGFSFHFRGGEENDREIERFGMWPGAIDLLVQYSPSAPNWLSYFWVFDRQVMPTGTRFFETEACFGTEDGMPLQTFVAKKDPTGTPVLSGFMFSRSLQDRVHELKLHVYRSNRNPDLILVDTAFSADSPGYPGIGPSYCVEVYIGLLPERRVGNVVHHSNGRPAIGSDVRLIEAEYPILQGFRLAFVDEDGDKQEHNLDEIGVILQATKIEISYNDKNDDDRFDWEVWYVDPKGDSKLVTPPWKRK